MLADFRRAFDAFFQRHPKADPELFRHCLSLSHHVGGKFTRRRFLTDVDQRRVRERADWIEAHIAPQLEPDFGADIAEHRCFQSRADECLRYLFDALAFDPVQLSDRKAVAFEKLDDSRRDDFTGGVDDTADDAPRFDALFDHAVRIGALEPVTRVRAIEILKVPPGQTILDRHHDGVCVEQSAHLRRRRFDDIGLQRQKHEILRPRVGAARHCAQVLRSFFGAIGADELEAISLDCFQMRAPIYHSDALTREREPHRKHAAHRTRADDRDFHRLLLHARSPPLTPPKR